MFLVSDDLTIQPFYISSVLCNKHGISTFDIEEFDLKIGKEEVNLLDFLFYLSTIIHIYDHKARRNSRCRL